MKSRLIIKRNTCITPNALELEKVYQCVKFENNLIKSNDFWHGAMVWKNSEKLFINETLGYIPKNAISVIVNGVLFPFVNFDKEFKFLLINKSMTLTASECKWKTIEFSKTFSI